MKLLKMRLAAYIEHRAEAICFDTGMVKIWNKEISKTLRQISILRARNSYQERSESNNNNTFIQLSGVNTL